MWWQHGLPEEDGVIHARPEVPGVVARTIAVVATPRISNLDEFQPLNQVPGVNLKWARGPADLTGADWVILPGSKHTSSDLAWLRAQGLDRAIAAHAAQGGAVLGICGGLQMLGEALIDPHGIDGNAPGLGLLPLVTVFELAKTVQRAQCPLRGSLARAVGCFDWRVGVAGYENPPWPDRPAPRDGPAAGDLARVALTGPQGAAPGLAERYAANVLGLYLHGLFEDPSVLQALFGASRADARQCVRWIGRFCRAALCARGALEALVAESGSTGA
jgi:adenosylcobyric acid synthase